MVYSDHKRYSDGRPIRHYLNVQTKPHEHQQTKPHEHRCLKCFECSGFIGFIPPPSGSNNASLYTTLLNEMSQNLNWDGYVGQNDECLQILQSLTFEVNTSGSVLQFFDSLDDFESWMNSNDYAASDAENNRTNDIGLLITMNDVNAFDYTISVNDSNQADTTHIVDEYEADTAVLWSNGAGSYLENGFSAFQMWMEQSIVSVLSPNGSAMPFDYQWYIFVYPSTKYEKNTFWEVFKYQLPTVVLFMFLFEIVEIINNLVGEKVEGIREELKMYVGHISVVWKLVEFVPHFVRNKMLWFNL